MGCEVTVDERVSECDVPIVEIHQQVRSCGRGNAGGREAKETRSCFMLVESMTVGESFLISQAKINVD